MSVFDLPGICVSAKNKDEHYLIKVFENLAAKYIKKQNALVICAIQMAADLGLLQTSAIIKQYKAEGRTIGVLNKADLLPGGSTHLGYDSIFKGKTHILPRGYFITKQPDDKFKQTKSDFYEQAREERSFILTTIPSGLGNSKIIVHFF